MYKDYPFLHIVNRTLYSIGAGSLRAENLIEYCKATNSPAIGICDFDNLYGIVDLSQKLIRENIQPIIGCSINIIDSTQDNLIGSRLNLFIQNDLGYSNLLKIIKMSYDDNGHSLRSYPSIDIKQIEGLTEGIIALSGAYDGALSNYIERDMNYNGYLNQLLHYFDNRLYIEIQRQNPRYNSTIERRVLDLAVSNNIPIIASCDARFYKKEDYDAYKIFRMIGGNERGDVESNDDYSMQYLMQPQEIQSVFSDLPEAIENTNILAQRCTFVMKQRPISMPSYSDNSIEELKSISLNGLKYRLANNRTPSNADDSVYYERLDREIQVIIDMGFADYFLVVYDFIDWSKKQSIPVGPGRGSGAGSVVAWSLGITDIDPIYFNLIFERFLNPERVSMPDFDIDFCQDRRDEVINYVYNKYSKSNVAQITTLGSLQSRSAIRDAGRVLGMSYRDVDTIVNRIPIGTAVNPVNLTIALAEDENLRNDYEKDEDIKRLFDISLKLEGLYRHRSVHAAGIVISDVPLDTIIPVYKDTNQDTLITSLSMNHLEYAGLIKFDFLGLKTLSIIKDCLENIKKVKGETVDLNDVSLDNQELCKFLSKGRTTGVFQLDSHGMQATLRRVKPDNINDIIAIISLYRPGPMAYIQDFIDRKHKVKTFEYRHPKEEEILKDTFGIMVYQEQVIQITQALAGFSAGAADILRRAIGKKKQEEIEAQKNKFIAGCVSNGLTEKLGAEIFSDIEKFAGYGFNKSHAAAYAMISWHTAYLKFNYTAEYIASSMSYSYSNHDELLKFAYDGQDMGVEILSPSVNQPSVKFSVIQKGTGTSSRVAVVYGLAAIKDMSMQLAEVITESFNQYGDFKNLEDFLNRISKFHSSYNKRQIKSLLHSGALDNLGYSRAQLISNIDNILAYISTMNDRPEDQDSLFGAAAQELHMTSDGHDIDRQTELQNELIALGYFLNNHPLTEYEDNISNDKDIMYLSDAVQGEIKRAKIIGVLMRKRYSRFSKDSKMLTMIFTDSQQSFEANLFSDSLNEINQSLQLGAIYTMSANIRYNEYGETKITVSRIKEYIPKKIRKKKESSVNIDKLPKIDKNPPISTVQEVRPIIITLTSNADLNEIEAVLNKAKSNQNANYIVHFVHNNKEIKTKTTISLQSNTVDLLKDVQGVIGVKLT